MNHVLGKIIFSVVTIVIWAAQASFFIILAPALIVAFVGSYIRAKSEPSRNAVPQDPQESQL